MLPLIREQVCKLDSKNRVVIPRKVRDRIDIQTEGIGWYLVPGYDGTISLYTPATFQQLAAEHKAERFRQQNIRTFDRLYYGLSDHVEMDRLGRILIPGTMLRRTGMGRDLTIVGVRDHLEIWDKAKWEQFVADHFADYEEIAHSAYETEREDARRSSS